MSRQEDWWPLTDIINVKLCSIIKAKYADDATFTDAMECWFYTTKMMIDDVIHCLV